MSQTLRELNAERRSQLASVRGSRKSEQLRRAAESLLEEFVEREQVSQPANRKSTT